jgi:hypothetical protein
MKIYHPSGRYGLHTVAVAPAAIDRTANVEEWQDEEGNPRTLTVRFVYGEAVVDDSLGRFLISKGLAKKSRTIIQAF